MKKKLIIGALAIFLLTVTHGIAYLSGEGNGIDWAWENSHDSTMDQLEALLLRALKEKTTVVIGESHIYLVPRQDGKFSFLAVDDRCGEAL